MTDWQVAIPTHRRAGIIRERTVGMLLDGGVDPTRIDVWVADPDEVADYETALDGTGVHVAAHGAGLGITPARNWIAAHYPTGTRLVEVDDDLPNLVRKDGNGVVPVRDVNALIEYGWRVAGSLTWGLHAVANGFYMAPTVRVGLAFLDGSFTAHTITDPPTVLTLAEKEDWERTLLHFERDGAVVRLDGYSFINRYQTEPGGLEGFRSHETNEAAVASLLDRWGGLLAPRVSKQRNSTELRVRPTFPPARTFPSARID